MIEFTGNGIVLHGKEIPLYSGSVHYWRSEREKWDTLLEHIKDMGFEIIETYIPWSVHEYEEGKYDFGEIDSSKDLDGFLSLCEEKGLHVIVRPGPHINAEMTLFGYPEWILMDQEIQARTPWGSTVVYPYATKQFPIPSYASEKLYEKTEVYFNKLAPVLRKHIHERGCIILIQADNETCNFFRDRPYIMDYSPASTALYHRFLTEKYGSISELNLVYRSAYNNFVEIKAPRGFKGTAQEDLPYYFDWVEYKEYQILDSLKRIINILDKLELGIPIFHNCAYQDYTPISVQRDEMLGNLEVAGIDAYPEPGDTAMLRRRIRYLAGSSRLPFVPEFGSGSWFDREVLLTAEEEEFGYLYSIMNGLKAVNFYMLVERDRWSGCPVTNDGRKRLSYFNMFSNMMKMMKEHSLHLYTRKPKILILRNYDMGRFKALYSIMDLNILSSNCFINGLDIPQELFSPDVDLKLNLDYSPGSYSDEKWIDQISGILDSEHYDYNYSDQYLPAEKWMDYDVIIASSYDFMDKAVQEQLLQFSQVKDKQLILGPYIPYLDRDFNKCSLLEEEIKRQPDGPIIAVRKPEAFHLNLLHTSCPVKASVSWENPNIEVSVHKNLVNPKAQLLYIANKAAEAQTAQLYFKGACRFSAVWRSNGLTKDGSLVINIPAHTVQIWKVEREEAAND